LTGGEPDLEEKSRNRFAVLIAVILTAAYEIFKAITRPKKDKKCINKK